jgi:hypothetical protein
MDIVGVLISTLLQEKYSEYKQKFHIHGSRRICDVFIRLNLTDVRFSSEICALFAP